MEKSVQIIGVVWTCGRTYGHPVHCKQTGKCHYKEFVKWWKEGKELEWSTVMGYENEESMTKWKVQGDEEAGESLVIILVLIFWVKETSDNVFKQT
jgi:hypothetical protein